MKYKIKMDLDLTSGDILEKEVQEAIRAYAKNVAREEIKKEIYGEIVEIARTTSRRMSEKGYWTKESDVDKIVREEVRKYVSEQMNSATISGIVQSETEKAINEQRITFGKYVAAEFDRQKRTGYVADIISKATREMLPGAVIDILSGK